MKSMIVAIFVVLALATAYAGIAVVSPWSAGLVSSPLVAAPLSAGIIAPAWAGPSLVSNI
ncbi:unnamed protein product [Tenebrio molitor]|nr:unnamed protein product [Tenebrio molitor]